MVNGHVSASRVFYLQRLGPAGFEELLAKIELAHRQVTSRSALSLVVLTLRILGAAMLMHVAALT